MRAVCALLFTVLALIAAHGVQARVFAGIGWGGSGQADDPRRLDVHAPAAPGPHPLVVVAGVDEGERLARALAERGHVVALLAPGRAATREELAQALAFLYWRGPGYGADSTRLNVVAAGAAADALLALARDPAPLHGAGVPPGTLQAAVVVDWQGVFAGDAPSSSLPLPALLASYALGDPRARVAAGGLAERWRAFGAAAESVAVGSEPGGGESVADAVRRWLPVISIPRVPRFESLRFDAAFDSLPPDGRATALAAQDDALFVAVEGAMTSVWRQDARAGAWRREMSIAAARVLYLGAVGEGEDSRLTLVVADDASMTLRVRNGRGDWGPALRLADASAHARAAWVAPLRGLGARAASLLVAIDAGTDSRLFGVRADGSLGIESLPAGQRITGLAEHAGAPLLAVQGAGGGRLLRRAGGELGAWVTAAVWDNTLGALHGLVSIGPEADAVAGLLDNGNAVRIEPSRGRVVVEADLSAALDAQWGSGAAMGLPWSAPMVALRQPVTSDRVHLAGITARDPRSPARAGWYVVRQAGGHYAYGRAGDPGAAGPDGAALRALVPSPFVTDAGAAFHALTDGTEPRLWRAMLAEPRVVAGAWIDRAVADVGVVFEPTRFGWVALLHRVDDDGARRWYSASGRMRGDAFEEVTGLLRYRLDGDGRLQAEGVGQVSVRFGIDASDPACAEHSRAGVWALARLEVRIGESNWTWCIEPVASRSRVRPAVDGSGVWMGPDGTWGLALQSDGHGDHGGERALLFHFDADGLPTWRLGHGERRGGAAVVALPDPAGDARVAYSFRGSCGAIEGSARVDWPEGAARGSEGEVALLRSAGGACY